jgi:hypothetical protein
MHGAARYSLNINAAAGLLAVPNVLVVGPSECAGGVRFVLASMS